MRVGKGKVIDWSETQILRDFNWLFTSPALITSSSLKLETKPLDRAWFSELQSTPDKIFNFIVNENPKSLGAYFEALWEFYFLHYPGKKLIAKNLQVFNDRQTIGEFDFIYLDEVSGKNYHLEVAIKYFLGVEQSELVSPDTSNNINQAAHSPMQNWLGPNARDRFDKKYNKMFEHQSQLSRTTEGKSALESLNMTSVQPQICMLGYFFYPSQLEINTELVRPPLNSNAGHNRGHWLKVSQLEPLLPKYDCWAIRNKPNWLASVRQASKNLSTREQIILTLKNHFDSFQRPILVSNFSQMESDQFESDGMFFVVPDLWPRKII